MRAAKDYSRVALPALALLLLALACSLPGRGTPTPIPLSPVSATTQTSAPTPTPLPPLPPALVEMDPPPGSDLPLSGPLTFYFNQPMDRLSVEGALAGQPGLAGRFTWQDDSTMVFISDAPFPPDADLVLTLNNTARAANGLALQEPVTVAYQTTGLLQVSEVLPAPGSEDVNPSAAIVATFNQPVVPLGAGPDAGPEAFTLSPVSPGRGEWLNTSTYIYYPEPALFGGLVYNVSINPVLASTGGSPLAPETGQPVALTWTFSTASPRLLAWEPDPEAKNLPLDASIQFEFNQPMDPGSVAEHLVLLDSNGSPVAVDLTWEADFSQLTIDPARLLARDAEYQLVLNPDTQSAGGAALGEGVSLFYRTVPPLDVLSTDPAAGSSLEPHRGVQIRFNGPLSTEDLEEYITFSPEVLERSTYWDHEAAILYVNGFFQPEVDYLLELDAGLADPWGGVLGDPYRLAFPTAPLSPDLTLAFGSSALFLTPADSAITVQATNLPEIQISLGSVSLDLFIRLLGPGGYQLFDNLQPEDVRGWTYPLDLLPNRSQFVDIPLSPDGRPLAPGLYFLRLNAPGLRFPPGPVLLVVSDVHLTFKLSAQQGFLWAVDLQANKPLVDIPVTLYNEDGTILQEGRSGPTGVVEVRFLPRENLYETRYAVSGQPGEPGFSLALSTWETGVAGWWFGIPVDLSPPGLKTYIYTDRPIYRPGQTVYFRAALRYAENGRYSLPDSSELVVSLFDDQRLELSNRVVDLSAFGTGHGEFHLPETAAPGFYTLATDFGEVSIQVAEFRKPEIDLQVSLMPTESLAEQTLAGEIQARYFFGAPAADIQVEWTLYSLPATFHLPGYQVGPLDTRWLLPPWASLFLPLGQPVESGLGRTGADGSINLDLTTEASLETRTYTLEVTARDETGIPVSYRASALIHPGQQYIGVRAENWVGQAGRDTAFEVFEVDWAQNPVGERALQAEFLKVVWVEAENPRSGPFNLPEYIPEYTLIAETTFATDQQGRARVAFTPPDPGTYQLNVRDGQAETQVLVWVGGVGQAVWPALPNQQVRLTADKESYRSGETAQIFIPNPLGDGALALVTVERGEVMRHRVITLGGSGSNFPLDLEPGDAPNIYLAVTILGRDRDRPDFRQGYINLAVEPLDQTLQVTLQADPLQAGPGDQVELAIKVADNQGNPVQGEFSLALVDQSTLSLAEPNAPDIQAAFYGEQPLGVRNSLALAAYAGRPLNQADGVGGGGGEADTPFVREDFEDTAFWLGAIVTDANGEARVTVVLPDNLTTWQADLRGLTMDTRVGQAMLEVVATKDLLIRPETPRFLVVGDHVQLAAIVHNNTEEALDTQVSLQPTGFTLDDPAAAVQGVILPPGSRQRIVWWGIVEAVPEVDLVFSAHAPGYSDAARPQRGALPVLAYNAPQAFATSGTLLEPGERLELVSPPRTFDPAGGELQVELAPSVAAAASEALASLEATPYESNEQLVSRFLANLELFHTYQALGLQTPGLEEVMATALSEGIARLGERQNTDGGWPWWAAAPDAIPSDPYITAYALFGLVRARELGFIGQGASIEAAIRFTQATLFSPDQLTEVWELDRLVFSHFVLTKAGAGDQAGLQAFFDARARLNPWCVALLALSLESLSPGDGRVDTLVADLQASAARLETGAFWPLAEPGWPNMDTTIRNSAVVIFALSQLDPAVTLLPDSIRYLMAARTVSGGWQSSFETAWSILAVAAYIRGTGELGADFTYRAELNDVVLTESQAAPPVLTPIRVVVPLTDLRPDAPNALRVQREAGPGRLYYRAYLLVSRPVETVPPLASGLQINRVFRPFGVDCRAEQCTPIEEGRVGELVTVRLTLIIEHDVYYLKVEDHFPAGSEIVDLSLQTSQLGLEGLDPRFDRYDPTQPFAGGWGWWWFSPPQIRDERISWSAPFLQAGTYELAYTLTLTQGGTYRVLPARAWQAYFPEVQGTTGGGVFSIVP